MTLVCLVAVGTVYGYARYRLGEIKTIAGLPTTATASSLSPMNILLVGDNSRVGLDPAEAAQFGTAEDAGGAHSDVTMVLHLDPKTGAMGILSIPRDLFVPLPPNNISGNVGKIDSALNGSNYQYTDGAAQLITTVQNDLGIPINHFVQINFDGFQQTINALGGINMNFPTRLFDLESDLRIYQTGCLHLNGATALEVVRSRHLQYYTPGSNLNDPRSWPQEQESDLARIERNHIFLQVLAASVTSQGITTNVAKLNDIVGAVINQVTVDPGLKSDLIPLIKRFRHVNLNSVPELTLPISVVPPLQYQYAGGAYGQVDFPVQPLDHQVVDQWQGSPIPTVDPSSITVRVDNISKVAHQAADTVATLTAMGFTAVNMGQGNIPADPVETMVRYPPGATGLAQAETVLEALAGSVMMKSDPSVPIGTIALDTGTSLTAASPAAGASPTTAVSSPAATTTTIPTPGQQPISSANEAPSPWDPAACTPGQPVANVNG